MAQTGVKFEMNPQLREAARLYVRQTGLWIEALAALLKISKPTLYRVFKDDPSFLTELEEENQWYRQGLVRRARPEFLLERQFRREFKPPAFNLEGEILHTHVLTSDEALKMLNNETDYRGTIQQPEDSPQVASGVREESNKAEEPVSVSG